MIPDYTCEIDDPDYDGEFWIDFFIDLIGVALILAPVWVFG